MLYMYSVGRIRCVGNVMRARQCPYNGLKVISGVVMVDVKKCGRGRN